VHIKCSDRTLRDWGHGGRVGFGSVSPTIGVLVPVGNKLGNRLVMVRIELAKPETSLISEY
jgi:hypothetical protein